MRLKKCKLFHRARQFLKFHYGLFPAFFLDVIFNFEGHLN